MMNQESRSGGKGLLETMNPGEFIASPAPDFLGS
jgi:hypothetical protein